MEVTNLRGYGGHLLVRAVKERHLAVLDSFQFTMKSLNNLVEMMDDEDFLYTKQMFPTDEKLYLMRKTGVFPYDLFSDLSKLNDTEFPPRESFYNKVEDKECSMKDYLDGKLVWNMFERKTFREYHDLYLKSDVILLTDFFEKFRRTCMGSYGLDVAHYYSAPRMAWDAALKPTCLIIKRCIPLSHVLSEVVFHKFQHDLQRLTTSIANQ